MAAILLVDPNASFRRMMEQLLRQQKHDVWGADDAETAGRSMRDRDFDAAIVELVLTGEMSGTELLEWLRDFPAPGDPARIALCSLQSFASQEAYLRAELALDGFLLKPFKPSDFRQVVDAAIKARMSRPARTKAPAPPIFAPPPTGKEVLELAPDDLIPLETNPGLVNAPVPSVVEFETASAVPSVSLENVPAPAASERRAVTRYPVRLPVVVHDGKTPFRARSENIGRGGMFVATDRQFELGTRVRLRLDLPVAGTGFNEIVAEVVHAELSGPMTGFAVRFAEMSEETGRRLDTFLEDLRQPAKSRPLLLVASASLHAEVEKIAQSFRNEEMRVRMVQPAEDLNALAANEPPDLMLLDLVDARVHDAVSELKSTRATSRIPVGLVDRTNSPQVALIAAAAGADRFFVLPDDFSRLVNFSVDTLAASRRRSVRVRFQRRVSLTIEGKAEPADAIDLSETGLQVRLIRSPRVGMDVTVAIPLSDGQTPLTLPAHVAWISDPKDSGGKPPLNPAEAGIRVGLLFEPDEPSRARIREEVRRALQVSYYVRWLSSAPKAPATTKPAATG